MTDFVANAAPGIKAPKIGAGSTLKTNDFHLFRTLFDLPVICSEVDFHVLPTSPLLANLRFPTDVALSQKTLVSWRARAATAALKTLTNGHAK